MLNKKCETEPIISHCRIGTNVFVAISYIDQVHATELMTTIATGYVYIWLSATAGYAEHPGG